MPFLSHTPFFLEQQQLYLQIQSSSGLSPNSPPPYWHRQRCRWTRALTKQQGIQFVHLHTESRNNSTQPSQEGNKKQWGPVTIYLHKMHHDSIRSTEQQRWHWQQKHKIGLEDDYLPVFTSHLWTMRLPLLLKTQENYNCLLKWRRNHQRGRPPLLLYSINTVLEKNTASHLSTKSQKKNSSIKLRI